MLNKIFRLIFPIKNPLEIREKYNIPEKIELECEITSDGYFVITSSQLPGLITQVKNEKELLDMVNDAILTYFDVPRKEGDIIFDTIKIKSYKTIKYRNKLKTT